MIQYLNWLAKSPSQLEKEALDEKLHSTTVFKTQHIPEEVSHTKEGYLVGHASNYVKVEFKGTPDLIGEVVPVKVVKADYPICQGEITK